MSSDRISRISKFSRLALMAGAASVLAACSSDVERLSDYPPIDTTASVNRAADSARTAPVERVAARRLDNAQGAPATPSWSNQRSAWRAPAAPSVQPRRSAYNAPVASAPRAVDGYLTVRPGQTLYSIARANGTSVSRLAAANNLSDYNVRVGQRLRIPGRANPVSPAPTVGVATAAHNETVATPVRAAPEKRNYTAARASTHRVAAGETLFSLGRKYKVNPYKIAAYNGLPRNVQLKRGQVVRIPPASGWSMAAPKAAPVTQPPANTGKPQHMAQSQVKKPTTTRKDDARIGEAPRQPVQPTPIQQAQAATPGGSSFLWPVRGRVVSTFGSKPGGVRNEGINIAVPEGADVRAASDGVVAYAGNELKGYGNLVLIRHKNGWVTAYAHNKELLVKRGQRVRRGEVIAKAGSTGSVKTPQLHFELRKGASAVNPLKHLGTRTAMN